MKIFKIGSNIKALNDYFLNGAQILTKNKIYNVLDFNTIDRFNVIVKCDNGLSYKMCPTLFVELEHNEDNLVQGLFYLQQQDFSIFNKNLDQLTEFGETSFGLEMLISTLKIKLDELESKDNYFKLLTDLNYKE